MLNDRGSLKVIVFIVLLALIVVSLFVYSNDSGVLDDGVAPSSDGLGSSNNDGLDSSDDEGIQTLNIAEGIDADYQGVTISLEEINPGNRVTIRFEKGISVGMQTLGVGQTLRGISIGDSNSGFVSFAVKLVSVNSGTVALEVGPNELFID